MRTGGFFILILAVGNLSAGCRSDIVCTQRVKLLSHKCVYIEPLQTQDLHVGKVLRDVIEKEFARRRFEICDANSATILVSGAAFMTERSVSKRDLFGSSGASSEAIESVSLVVKNRAGELLATASYDNNERYTASKLGTELGGALAGKLK